MSGLSDVLERLLRRDNLTEVEAGRLLETLASGEMEPAMAGAVLAALRAKGETADELRGFAAAMRGLARRPDIDGPLLDVVGTGGDGSRSLNLSTGAALLAAACGAPVAKHGNRSVSSLCGSADVLEALGMRLPLDEATAASCLAETGFTFLFAPWYHPAMKSLAPVRRALGVRTVFNLLGPLTNPAAPPFLLLGAFSVEAAGRMAAALAGDGGVTRAFVVHGEPGWDEATPVGPFRLFDVRDGEVREETRDPLSLGVSRCDAVSLAGGDAEHNAARLRAVFAGEDDGPHAEALVLGAALALEVCGRVASAADGVEQARAALAEGRAAALLGRLEEFFAGRAV